MISKRRKCIGKRFFLVRKCLPVDLPDNGLHGASAKKRTWCKSCFRRLAGIFFIEIKSTFWFIVYRKQVVSFHDPLTPIVIGYRKVDSVFSIFQVGDGNRIPRREIFLLPGKLVGEPLIISCI